VEIPGVCPPDDKSETPPHWSYLDFHFESSPDAVVMVDNDGRILRANDEFLRLFGFARDELEGRLLDDLIAPDHLREEAVQLSRRVDAGERVLADTIRRRKDGSAIDVMVTGMPIRMSGAHSGQYAIYRDLRERAQIRRDKQISDHRLRLVTENALDIITVLNGEGSIQYVGPSVERVLGWAPEERVGRSAFELIHPDDARAAQVAFARLREEPGPGTPFEFRHAHRDASWRVLEAVPNNLLQDPAVRGIVMTLRDVTDRRRAEEALRESQERLAHDALHDALTGLPNRILFMERLEARIAGEHRRREELFGVLFLDLDRFKIVNDSLGHLAGDLLLTAIARRLELCLRPGDIVARLGGDEFTVLLHHLDHEQDAIRIADRIAHSLSAPFNLNGHDVFTSASIGIALSSTGYRAAEDCLRDADTAMYRAKSAGKARYEVFDRSMHAHAVSLLQLETDLRHAVTRGEFFLEYQPILCLSDDCLVGVEALLRWRHPERGVVGPDQFLPLAEETGLMLPIGRWAMTMACRQMRRWKERHPDHPELAVNINVSARQFDRPGLVAEVAEALAQSGLAPSALKLEITESILMANAAASAAVLDRLRRLGVQVQIDDFGTGYSSLSYLHRFRVDTLKIDRSFVAGLTTEGESREIVRTILTLGRNLGVDIVAEGVETEAQRETLRALGCRYVQGFLFARPLQPDAVDDLLAAG
jgi:diguanylate cyclase (GGDEF)-like protein/PAS domain S-box-containing protein